MRPIHESDIIDREHARARGKQRRGYETVAE